jgi:type I restriction enzyme S subunit
MPPKDLSAAETRWPRVRIADVAEVFDGPHATPTKTSDGPVFLGISSLNRGRLDLSNTEHLFEEEFVKWTRRVTPTAGDVVFSYETRLGEAAIIPEGLRCCLGRRMGLVRTKPSALDPHFFLYQYLSPKFQDFLMSRTIHGSTVDRIALKEFPDFEIDLPPLPVQRMVAKVMLEIDAKIDLNRRINQTLEATAQAIFQSWFVDFDPVKAKVAAKAEGRDPLRAAMSAISGKADAELDAQPPEQYERLAATAALFPDEMDASELGEVPKGWIVEPLSKMIQLIGGGTPKRSEPDYWGGDVLWYSVKDAPLDGDVWVVDTEEKITNLGLQKSSTKLLPVGTTIISARGTVGKLALVGKEMAMNQSCYGVAGADGIGSYFNYFNLKDAVEVLKRNVHGAVFDTITQATFETVPRIRPLNEQHEAFEQRVRPLLEEILSRVNQNRILAVLRDTLLPKLLSGELSVEAFTEAAGVA